MRKALHRKTTEKLSDDERQLIFEDLEAALLEIETASDAAQMLQ